MALPVGVITATVTWGTFLDYLGVPLTTASVTFVASTDVTWSATGVPLFASPLVVQGVSGSIVLPATDQPGFVAGGAPVTGWSYVAVIRVPGQPDRVVIFQLPTAGATGVTLDLDALIPLGTATAGTVVTLPAILSVNGQTGPTVTLTAVSVGALPAEAPATLKNTSGNALPFRVRNAADSADILNLTSVGALGVSSTFSANAVVAVANSVDAVQASGAAAGIRFGATAGQTYLARAGAQVIYSDSYLRSRVVSTASRATAASAGQGSFYFDTTLNKPVWSDGTNWRDAAGTIV